MIRRLRAAFALLLAGVLAGAPVVAFGEGPPTEAGTVPAVSGTLTSASPTVLGSASILRVTTTLDAASLPEVAGHQVHLRLTDASLTSHDQIARFLDAPESFHRRTVAEQTIASPMSASASGGTIAFAVPAGDLGLSATTPGVYGLTVTVIGADGAETISSMVVTWAPVPLPSLQVAALATVTGNTERTASVVTASDLEGVTMLVDPTLGAVDALASHELLRIPAANADLTSLARNGGASLIDFSVGAANDQASAVLRTLPLVTPVAVADQATIDAAFAAGARAVILDPRFDLDGISATGDAAVVDVASGDSMLPVIRPDATLSTVLATSGMEDVADSSRLVAEAAVAALYGDTDTVVVSPGQAWAVAGDGTSEPLEALLEAPWVETVPLSSLLESEDRPQATVAASSVGTTDDLDDESVAQLSDALEGVQVIASAATDPAGTLDQYALGLLRAVSLPSRAGLGTRAAIVSGALATAQEAIDGVSVASSADINFIAAEGSLPVTVRNTTEQELTVIVSAFSSSPQLRITGRPEVTVGAGSEAVVQIPVTAVSTANVGVTLTIRTPDGDVVSSPQTLRVRVRADWGNAATVVFSVMLVLLLAAGVIRTVRRGRRDTRLSPSALDAPVEESLSGTETRDNT